LAQARDQLGPVAWDAAIARGVRLTVEEALALATSADVLMS
jgi:hypothetical protein